MIAVSLDQVKKLAPNARQQYLDTFKNANEVLARHGINDNALRLAHFMAQVLHESDGCWVLRESMRYKAKRILEVFGKKHSAKVTPAEAEKLAGNSEALAKRVYGLGNPDKAKELGNKDPGDGFKYRGRGLIQVTGRGSYKTFGKRLGIELEKDPELAIDPRYILEIAAAEWTEKNCNFWADKDNIIKVTKKINGGDEGLASRRKWLEKTKATWP